jgi:hypothetical protein
MHRHDTVRQGPLSRLNPASSAVNLGKGRRCVVSSPDTRAIRFWFFYEWFVLDLQCHSMLGGVR